MQDLGTYARVMSPDELASFIRHQQAAWKAVIVVGQKRSK
jgi:hypothetical protein